MQNLIPLIIPDDVLDKIEYLCQKIAKVEWSGLLFYQVEGSIKDSKNVKLVCKDILLMDKGSSAYTEYDWDEDIVEYRMNNPESMDWLVGHIHSHNTMNVFFSGTDMSELNDNCPNHNIYLSLIVNNYLEMTAKVAFTATPKLFVCKDEEGKDYTLQLYNDSKLSSYMFVYDCDISRRIKNVTVNDDFASRIKQIEEKAEKKRQEDAKKEAAQKAAQPNVTQYSQNQHKNYSGGSFVKSPFPDYVPKQHQRPADFFMGEDVEDDTPGVVTLEEQFAAFVLRLGNQVDDDDVVNALEDIGIANLSGESLSTSILESYPAYYEQFFDNNAKYNTDEAFLEVLESVIDYLTMYETEFDFITAITDKLKLLGNRFEQQSKEIV